MGAFFTAAMIDTKIVWDIATVIGPIATVPNLLAILFLKKEIKKLDTEYVIKVRKDINLQLQGIIISFCAYN